ncbi:ribonuclease E/G [Paracoccus sp. (in: a-proteobacteria)]|uniref:ribonuclease E/G n=1 Tax=Paracoccus sp. TaxID=267 RepID=UPI0026DFEB47|nr:ribonuclease E/G [Paracoccus sp. (in: a-proteobacteria)]MDO5371257.1 ribonuclease E/G [Paracoccus sp. (in: a-proteobacteria)]
MKGRQVVLGQQWGREAAALMVDGRVEDLLFDLSALTTLPPGVICRAVVDRLVKGQGGVFVRLPEGERGFLRDARGLSEGQALIVQVTGAPDDGKAIPVSQRVLFRGQTAIATPGAPGVNVSRRIRDDERRAQLVALGSAALEGGAESLGLVMRSAAAGAEDEEIADELSQLVTLATAVMSDTQGRPELLVDAELPWRAAWIDWADPPPDDVDDSDDAFDAHGVTAAIDALLDPELDLPGGGFAVIEATRALVAVDVNTGRDTSPAAALKANIALARDLPRQLRLRGLGGQVVIDFAPMPKRDRGTLEQVLRAAFKAEGTETTLVGWTAMGLYELNRKRDRVPLVAVALAGEDE